ncbi:hypothetical protein BDR26DRAFT_853736 [Obelidium mucronatum]|nr:hypothetical protein BDR26DRAFT_853736 [Obelidium mucronatum]
MGTDTSQPSLFPFDGFEAYNITLLAVYTLETFALIIFVLYENSWNGRALLKPYNLFLTLMGLFMAIHYAAICAEIRCIYRLNFLMESGNIDAFLATIQYLHWLSALSTYFSSAVDICYFLAGWHRSHAILKRMLVNCFYVFDRLLKAVLFIYILVPPFLLTILPLFLKDAKTGQLIFAAGNYIFIICLAILTAFDVGMVVVFVRYLRETIMTEDGEMKLDFLLIARFGIVSAAVYVLLSALYIAMVCGVSLPLQLFTATFFILFNTLCGLKVALYWNQLSKNKETLGAPK